jgi:hypothetical protein
MAAQLADPVQRNPAASQAQADRPAGRQEATAARPQARPATASNQPACDQPSLRLLDPAKGKDPPGIPKAATRQATHHPGREHDRSPPPTPPRSSEEEGRPRPLQAGAFQCRHARSRPPHLRPRGHPASKGRTAARSEKTPRKRSQKPACARPEMHEGNPRRRGRFPPSPGGPQDEEQARPQTPHLAKRHRRCRRLADPPEAQAWERNRCCSPPQVEARAA